MSAPRLLLPLLLALACASVGFALFSGTMDVPATAVWQGVFGDPESTGARIVADLRLPRALTGFVVGGLLAVSGALMQVLLRNPLADPYVLGVSGGAAVAALAVMLAGLGGFWVSAGSFAGALGSMLLVFGLAHGRRGGWTPTRLLLTGVVVAAGWGALISFLLAVSPERNLRGMLFWLMGDLGHASGPGWVGAVLILGVVAAFALARPLNIMARGDLQARALGVPVGGLRIAIYLMASLMTGAAVTLAGTVGFVGLVVPHMLRLVGGSDHRWLLPGAALAGGALLVVADALARVVIAPQQLPVGVITAMLGVPLFLFLLHRGPQASRT